MAAGRRGEAATEFRSRTADFSPLRHGEPFGIRSLEVKIELKRNKFRAPVVSGVTPNESCC